MRLTVLPFLLLLACSAVAQEAARAPEPTKAEKRAEELDKMFGRLRLQEARAEKRIWELWVQSESTTADVLLHQATKALSKAEYKAALPMLDKLVASYPTYPEAYNKRATLHFLQGEYDRALKDIDKALELEPRHFGALSGRGMIYKEQGKDRLALDALREALSINPMMEGIQAAIRELEKSAPEI